MRRSEGGGDNFGAGLACSIMLHALALVLMVFGLPHLLSPPKDMEEPMVVEVETISEKTNPPPRQIEAPKPEETPTPPKQEETPPPPPQPQPKPPEPKPEPPKPDPIPPPPQPKPPEPEPEPVPVPKPKPEPPKPDPKPAPPDMLKDIKPPPKKPPPPDDFDNLMKSVDKMREPAKPATPQPQSTPSPAQKTVNSPSLDPSAKPTMSEIDFIKHQIENNWNFDPGAKGVDTFKVVVIISINPEGHVLSARFSATDQARMAADSAFYSFASSAMRAVLKSDPLKQPPTRPDIFRANPEITMTFDPRSVAR